jgi:hypothetical protein
MRWPRWLDRELRIHRLNVLLAEAVKDRDLYWRLYQSQSAEQVITQVRLDNARADYAVALVEIAALRAQYEGNPSQ